MTEPADTPGLDLERFAAWFSDVADPAGPLTATLITGGRSNLTYLITDGVMDWVVRRPPLGHVLATAHDMGREFRMITALDGTGVPVPSPVAICTDAEVIGAPFYVMTHVVGRSYRHAAELVPLGAQRTSTIGLRLVDALSDLHRVDPAEVGLADAGRTDGFLERQVARWQKQLAASHSRELPAADRLHDALATRIPPSDRPGIVHGDYRLDNVLVDDSDTITALIDWEMATIGDPLTDLALLLIYQRLTPLLGDNGFADATLAPGYPSEDEILERYASRSDRRMHHFGFHLGLAAYKAAGILEGIHFRYRQGLTVGPDFDRIGAAVPVLLDIGLDALAHAPRN